MIVYHRTTAAAAQAIRDRGFMEGAECYGTARQLPRVVFTGRLADTGSVTPYSCASDTLENLPHMVRSHA
jgi:hypothetical protein